jgi:hypothetical protein
MDMTHADTAADSNPNLSLRRAMALPTRPPRAPCASLARAAPPPPPPRRPAAPPPRAAAAADLAADPVTTCSPEEYARWAAAAGIDADIEQATFPGGLRGARATAAVAAGARFASVPRAAALVVDPRGRCPCPAFVDAAWWRAAPWWAKMGALLLYEASRGRESPVWGYVAQLPPSIDAPVNWTPAELAELHYPPLEASVAAQRGAWERAYTSFAAAAAGRGGASISQARFFWALEAVRSRAFSGPYAGAPLAERAALAGAVAAAGAAYVALARVPLESALNGALAAALFNLLYDVVLSSKLKWHALLPVVDAVNHSSSADSTIEFEYFRGGFAAATAPGAARGEQLFISYGEQPGHALLQYYAFTEANNPHDVYRLDDVALAGAAAPVALELDAKGRLTPAAAAAARAAAPGLSEAAFAAALAGALEAAEGGAPTALAADERALGAAHLLAPRARAALEFRAEKKRLLRRGAERARRRAAKLAREAAPAGP